MIPLIVPYLNSMNRRSAAYALFGLGEPGFNALLDPTNNIPGIGDIIDQARQMSR